MSAYAEVQQQQERGRGVKPIGEERGSKRERDGEKEPDELLE